MKRFIKWLFSFFKRKQPSGGVVEVGGVKYKFSKWKVEPGPIPSVTNFDSPAFELLTKNIAQATITLEGEYMPEQTWIVGSFDDMVKEQNMGKEFIVTRVSLTMPLDAVQALAEIWQTTPVWDSMEPPLLIGVIRRVELRGDTLYGIIEKETKEESDEFYRARRN